jgi:hypothetical protein
MRGCIIYAANEAEFEHPMHGMGSVPSIADLIIILVSKTLFHAFTA